MDLVERTLEQITRISNKKNLRAEFIKEMYVTIAGIYTNLYHDPIVAEKAARKGVADYLRWKCYE